MPLLSTFGAASRGGFGRGGVAVLFVTATGGTVTTCGDFKIHTFTGPGTFCVSCAGDDVGSNSVEYMIVAGRS